MPSRCPHCGGDLGAAPVRPGLSDREAQVVALLRAAANSPNISPTLQQIGDGIGVTKVRAHELVRQLERKGWVTREPYTHRSVRLAPGA